MRMLAITTALAALVLEATAQSPPEIRSEGADIVFNAGTGGTVRTCDDPSCEVVTKAMFDKLQKRCTDQAEVTAGVKTDLEELRTLIADQAAAIKANMAMVRDLASPGDESDMYESGIWRELQTHAANTEAINTKLAATDQKLVAVEKIASKVSASAEGTSSCLARLNQDAGNDIEDCPVSIDDDVPHCQSLDEIENGQFVGGGTRVGATAFFSCNDGFQMSGPDVKVCHEGDLKWYPQEEVTCTPTVACAFGLDNAVTGLYIDGVETEYTGKPSWNTVHTVTFPASSKLLAVRGYDAENGCKAGGFAITCTSEADHQMAKKWNTVRSGTTKIKAVGFRAPREAPFGQDDWYQPGFNSSGWKDSVLAGGQNEYPMGWACTTAELVGCTGWCSDKSSGCSALANKDYDVQAICSDQEDFGKRTYWYFVLNMDDM